MEPQLKQRLVGAAVLVSLAILVVPVLLDGGYRQTAAPRRDMAPMPPDAFENEVPPLPPEVTETLDAGIEAAPDALSSSASEAAASVAPPDAAVEAPLPDAQVDTMPAAPAASAPPPAAMPPQAGAEVAVAAPEPSAKPATAATPAPEQWTVQLGSFSSRANAESLLGRVKATGVAGFILPLTEAGKTAYRVRAGPVAGRGAADRLRQELERSQAIRGMLVRYP